jgi:hypothetical protein
MYPELAFMSISLVHPLMPESVKTVCFMYCIAFQILDLIKVNPPGTLAHCVIDNTKNHHNINKIDLLKIHLVFVFFI